MLRPGAGVGAAGGTLRCHGVKTPPSVLLQPGGAQVKLDAERPETGLHWTTWSPETSRLKGRGGRRDCEMDQRRTSRSAAWLACSPCDRSPRLGPTDRLLRHRRRSGEGIMHIPPVPAEEVTMSNVTVRDNTESISQAMEAAAPYPVSFQVSLTGFLMLEIVLGLSSNLTVLVLYCMKSNLINSVSNVVTMNLHVLDVIVCVCCIPLTIVIILLSLEGNTVLVCCFHEACVSFASVATAANVLAITLDRYDISVKPANRVLTMGRAVVLLGAIWVLSFFSFLVPFMEVGFFSQERSDLNGTAAAVVAHTNQYYTELGLYYHLLAQIPIFFFTAVVMLITYSKILQALNIRIGTRFHASQKKKARKKKTISMTTQQEATDASQSSGGEEPHAGHAHKRVFRMSLLIISTFLLCWTPITVLNTVILSVGPSDLMVKLRLGFLVMAYGTTIFHPLLYAFTRQKFQKVLKSKMKKRVVSIVEADPLPNNTVIHNSWIDPKRNKKLRRADRPTRPRLIAPSRPPGGVSADS
ncbi:hypothetical protein ANANG_G00144220 [Anguilla anguilla]|uniref:G-protein coupled receptors family 1 profile domain-containing protein n=1 Tax=Anguilla anguilla TaxID=7936 RepID=A0A9D3ME92_ANGAN|nr:hypothetical protein ANANG_G00144220 [Anguilla anguilla]